ncbi:glutamate--tRNA ligase [Candidatus Comchoanobacter bicostacola]|uniref:Glutamate--tRNA ligase n=1 Tax=Candidatus Comchoanobacter bicostacola TaxID=2919598 RepID=A0ABY5DJ01_9GAMM|nr:glutamate--tRNA ligase [Candidatus Comchoanobacter bicostacola]UTC24230.1 glutamate--tRNA ligase [Candidatus Comchoanobacter bicostacola]
MSDQVRVRFAPSPTGSLHLGGVRTALYNYLLARHHQGSFVIRVEDTDLSRNIDDAASRQLNDLKWLGLTWDEGPDIGGDYEPYQQSKRLDLYQSYVATLLEQGKAFYCFLSDSELKDLHSHENRQLKSPHRDLTKEEVDQRLKAGAPYVIRFRNDAADKVYTFKDLVHGETRLPANMVGDFVLVRSNGHPVYNFCCAIDDHLMKITHVLRGEEHLSNTLRQLMVYESLDWKTPSFGHLSMILGPNKKKLSKRDDSAALEDFVKSGFLPQALLNYVALLGWSSADATEYLPVEQLIASFGLDRVHKSPAMFDREKLRWINHQHLVRMSAEHMHAALVNQVDAKYGKVDAKWMDLFWTSLSQQFYTLVEVAETIDLFSQGMKMPVLSLEDSEKNVVESFKQGIDQVDAIYIDPEIIAGILSKISEEQGVKGRKLFAPIRQALLGVSSGMEIKVLGSLLTKEEILNRISQIL